MKVKWIRMGECNRCGDCCRPDLLQARIKAYEEAGMPYKLVNKNCEKFDPETGLCNNYENRPEMCKIFPLHQTDIVALPRCGYYFILVAS